MVIFANGFSNAADCCWSPFELEVFEPVTCSNDGMEENALEGMPAFFIAMRVVSLANILGA